MCAASGLAFTVGCVPTPHSVATFLPPVQRLIWGLLLCIGGILALAGSFLQRTSLFGAKLEQTGVLAIGFGCIVYGPLVLKYAGDQATFPGSVIAGIGIASFVRFFQLRKALAKAEAIIDELEAHIASMPRAGG